MPRYRAKTKIYINDRIFLTGEIYDSDVPQSPDCAEPIDNAPMAERRFNWSADTFFDQRHYKL
jgi:hypothetical protein